MPDHTWVERKPPLQRRMAEAMFTARRWAHEWRGRDLALRRDVRVRRERLGSWYGGWVVCPDLLSPGCVVFSIGVGLDISFDLEMIRRHRARVFAFDPTPKSNKWLQTQTLPPEFTFRPLGIADHDGEMRFVLENPDFDSYSTVGRPEGAGDVTVCAVARLSSLMKDVGQDRIDVLKLDVEGTEYTCVPEFLSANIRPPQLLVELHYETGNRGQMDQARRLVDAIRAAGYLLFDRSAVGRELSFVHRDAVG